MENRNSLVFTFMIKKIEHYNQESQELALVIQTISQNLLWITDSNRWDFAVWNLALVNGSSFKSFSKTN